MAHMRIRPITPFVPNPYLSDKANDYHRKRWEAHNIKLADYYARKGNKRIDAITHNLKMLEQKFSKRLVLHNQFLIIGEQLEIIAKAVGNQK